MTFDALYWYYEEKPDGKAPAWLLRCGGGEKAVRDFAKGFYNTEPWLSVRKAFIASRIGIDGGLCQECRDELGYIVHHRIELTPQNINNPDICFSFANLEYVCLNCHNKIHGVCAPEEKIKFDEAGEPIPPSNSKKFFRF